MTEVTRLLNALEQGDPHAAGELLPLVYDQLRQLAAQRLALERPGQTLDATALVHEAYLRLVASPLRERGEEPRWDHRGHFFAAAAEAMRRVLIDNARRKQTAKHGGARRRVQLGEVAAADNAPDDLLALPGDCSYSARVAFGCGGFFAPKGRDNLAQGNALGTPMRLSSVP